MNRKFIKHLCSIMILIFSASLLTIPITAEDDIKVVLNGTELTFDVPPQIINDRTMVPMRAIFEALGARVVWVEESQSIYAHNTLRAIYLKIDTPEMCLMDASLDASKQSEMIIPLEISPQLVGGRTLVPVRAISEAFGVDVTWRGEDNTVLLEYSDDISQNSNSGMKGEISIVDPDNNVILTKADIIEARVEADRVNDETVIVVVLVLTEEGRNKFAIATEALIGGQLSILIGEDIISSPTVMSKIDTESVLISGNYSLEFATDLASMINGNEDVYINPELFTEITVSTAEEFINALGSNRKILLKEGVYNLSSVKLQDDSNKQVYWKEVYDGNELYLDGIRNLTIEGIGSVPTEIVIEPRYAYVLNFINSSNINISNIKAGHTDIGYCRGGVFTFEDSSDIYIDNTHMYGCGTEGLSFKSVVHAEITNSSIYECTYDIMSVQESINISFYNCVFRDNERFDLVNISDTYGFSIDNSEFRSNDAKSDQIGKYSMFSVSSSDNVSVTNTKFINNTAWVLSDTNDVIFENNTFEDNDFTHISHPRYSYPEVDSLSDDELSAYGIRLYMTEEEVVALNGKPISEQSGRFRNHYPFDDNQTIYNYGKYSVIFNEGTAIAIAINDTKYVTPRGIKIGDNNDTVMQKYGYTEPNMIWSAMFYTVAYKEGEFTTSSISFTFDDKNRVAEIMILQTGY